MRSSSAPSTARSPFARDAQLARDGQPGELVVAGDHHRPDAGGAALGDRDLDFLARRVDLADQPEQRGAAGQRVEAGARRPARASSTTRDGQHAQRPRRPCASAASRAACSAAAPSARHRRSTASGAPLMNTRRGASPAGGAWPSAWCRSRTAARPRAAHCCRSAPDVDAGLAGGDQQRGLGRVAEHRPAAALVLGRHQLGVVAQHGGLQQRADSAASRGVDRRAALAQRARRRVADAGDGDLAARRAATARVTVISLRVSVPVLSLQITVVEPSVSTADRRRMMAPRAAMRCMPTASAIVIATGRPSGTIDTIWLMATISTSASGSPRSRPSSMHDDEEHQRGAHQPAAELRDAQLQRRLRLARRPRSGRAMRADLGVRAGGHDHGARAAGA